MSIATFVEILFILVVGLVACTGLVLLIDHWRTRKLHRNVRAYEGLGDGDWLSREKPGDDTGTAPRENGNPEG